MAEMKTNLWIFSFFLAQAGVLMKPIHVSGAERGTVEFKCPYPDNYKYRPKYFCRHPCGFRDVIITSEKTEQFRSEGRYSVLDTTNAKTFSVTIKNLQLQDAGVYYCGLSLWGPDTLVKVVLTVSKAPTPVPPSATPNPTTLQQDYTPSSTQHSTGDGSETSKISPSTEIWSNQSASSTTYTSELHSGPAVVCLVCGVCLAVLVTVLMSLVILYRKSNADTQTHSRKSAEAPNNQDLATAPQAEEGVYNDILELTVYGVVDSDPTHLYSLIQPSDKPNMEPPRTHNDVVYSVIGATPQPQHTHTTEVYSITEDAPQHAPTSTSEVCSITEDAQRSPHSDPSEVYSIPEDAPPVDSADVYSLVAPH